MADKTPLKARYDAGGSVVALGEFEPGDAVPISFGGTGASNAAGARASLGVDDAAKIAVTQFSHRNRIIGHFDVNQRALTSVGDDAYCCDRWYVLTETGNVTVGQVSDPEPGAPFGWKLTQPDATAKRMGMATIIESKDVRAYRNAAMNFFMRVKPSFSGNIRYAIIEHTGTADLVTSDVVNNWSSATFTAGNFFISGLNIIKTGVVSPGAGIYGEFSDYGVMGAALNNAILFVWTESAQAQGASLEMNRPQFEPGVIHTPHEFRQNELALCQRYYEVTSASTYITYIPGGIQDVLCGSWLVEKRATPTLTLSNQIQIDTASAMSNSPTKAWKAGRSSGGAAGAVAATVIANAEL